MGVADGREQRGIVIPEISYVKTHQSLPHSVPLQLIRSFILGDVED